TQGSRPARQAGSAGRTGSRCEAPHAARAGTRQASSADRPRRRRGGSDRARLRGGPRTRAGAGRAARRGRGGPELEHARRAARACAPAPRVSVPLIRWDTVGSFEVAFSTRQGGVSEWPFESLNLGLLTDDDPAN